MLTLSKVYNELVKYDQFIVLKNKIPASESGLSKINPHDCHNWRAANDCIRNANQLGNSYGIGFVLTDSDPFFLVDIDHCIEHMPSMFSLSVLKHFTGACVEISQSRTGYHVIGSAKHIPHRCKNSDNSMELYTEKRIIALTGLDAYGDCGASFDLTSFVNKYFKPSDSASVEWTSEPVEQWTGYKDDKELINSALRSKGFNAKCTFKQLWTDDTDALEKAYPDKYADRNYDYSSADAALIQHLAFWTGKDCERIQSLLWQSSLVRDKWDVKGYLERSILNGVANCKQVYDHTRKDILVSSDSVKVRTGQMRLSVQDQVEFFKGCVYVKDCNNVLDAKGDLLTQDAFNWEYAGHIFELHSDDMTKTTTRAWDAIRNSFALSWPKVSGTCFRTDKKLGEIIDVEGTKLVNIYQEVITAKKDGDATPFIKFINKLLPRGYDAQILICYMAACVQYKGVKFRYAPVLQGVEGNGKTFISQFLKHCIGRKYTHFPVTNDLKTTFNSWVCKNLLICVEEFSAPGARNEIIETLKVMITNDQIGVQSKGVDQYTADNFANFIFTTQYKNAIRKNKNNRRFAIFYTAQQSISDLMRDGMNDQYFNKLHKWSNLEDGYAIVNHYLSSYHIADKYNPVMIARAPDTSMIDDVIIDSMGLFESSIIEAVKEGRGGFSGGWISSMALTRMIKNNFQRETIGKCKISETLKDLGYIHHPNLSEGRLNKPSAFDRGKTRLYVKRDSLLCNISSPTTICDSYDNAQMSPDNLILADNRINM